MSRKGENIYKRKDGRWEGRYCKTRDESGKIKYGYVYARTYTDTKSKLELVKKECLSLPEKSTGNFSIHTFADVAGEWLLYKKRILKETSISKYNNIINIHLLPFFREQDIHNITLEQMEAFYNALLMTKTAKGTALAPKTTLDILSVMKAILFYATTKKYMNILPVLRFEYRAVPKKLVVLSGRNQKILSTYLCLNLTYRNLGLLICMYTGIRLGEACALTWEDISLTEGYIYIHKTMQRIQKEHNGKKTMIIIAEPKTQSSIRTIPLPRQLI